MSSSSTGSIARRGCAMPRSNAPAAISARLTGSICRLVEQYPDSLPGQRALAEMALEFNDWDAARRHGAARRRA